MQAVYAALAALVLARPDQHVAWRGDRPPENPRQLVELIAGRRKGGATS